MTSDKYPAGKELKIGNIKGRVVENKKLEGDVCVKWENERDVFSYDEWFLDEMLKGESSHD